MKNRNVNVKQLIHDIEVLKTVIKKNNAIMRDLFLPRVYRTLSLFFGTAFIALTLGMYYLITKYGSYELIPTPVIIGFWAMIIIFFIVGGVFKGVLIDVHAKKIDPSFSLLTVYKEIVALPVYRHCIVLIIALLLFFIPFLVLSGNALYVVPLVMLMIAAGWILIGAQIALFSYLITGYYMLVTSMLSFVVCRTVHPLLILAGTLGIGFVLFGITGFFTSSAAEK